MAKELNFCAGQSGLTVTANIYLVGELARSGIPCPEMGATGIYSGDFVPGASEPLGPGVYHVAFFCGAESVARASGQIVWDGAGEVLQSGDSFARIGEGGAGITAILNVDVKKVNGVAISGAELLVNAG